jgi:hypothetical protein
MSNRANETKKVDNEGFKADSKHYSKNIDKSSYLATLKRTSRRSTSEINKEKLTSICISSCNFRPTSKIKSSA